MSGRASSCCLRVVFSVKANWSRVKTCRSFQEPLVLSITVVWGEWMDDGWTHQCRTASQTAANINGVIRV